VDCVSESWGTWGPCWGPDEQGTITSSYTCARLTDTGYEPGEQRRYRKTHMDNTPRHGGKACGAEVSTVCPASGEPCYEQEKAARPCPIADYDEASQTCLGIDAGDETEELRHHNCRCPLDCQFSAWSTWSTCSKECDDLIFNGAVKQVIDGESESAPFSYGDQKRTRAIASIPRYGGMSCADKALALEQANPSGAPPSAVNTMAGSLYFPASQNDNSVNTQAADGSGDVVRVSREGEQIPRPIDEMLRQQQYCNDHKCPVFYADTFDRSDLVQEGVNEVLALNDTAKDNAAVGALLAPGDRATHKAHKAGDALHWDYVSQHFFICQHTTCKVTPGGETEVHDWHSGEYLQDVKHHCVSQVHFKHCVCICSKLFKISKVVHDAGGSNEARVDISDEQRFTYHRSWKVTGPNNAGRENGLITYHHKSRRL
jgi:hypothetical protein